MYYVKKLLTVLTGLKFSDIPETASSITYPAITEYKIMKTSAAPAVIKSSPICYGMTDQEKRAFIELLKTSINSEEQTDYNICMHTFYAIPTIQLLDKNQVRFEAPVKLYQSLVKGMSIKIKADGNRDIKWTVVSKEKNNFVICKYNSIKGKPNSIRIQAPFSSVNYDRQRAAISGLTNGYIDEILTNVFFGDFRAFFSYPIVNLEEPCGHPPLNASQKQAAIYALQHYFTVIQGPPGTGKSRLIAYLAYSLMKAQQRVLIVTKSNAAANILALKMNEIARHQFFRVLSKSYTDSCPQEIIPFTIGHYRQTHNVQNQTDSMIISTRMVTITTTSTSGSEYFSNVHFDAVIVDEAGQVLDTELLIPLSSSVNRLILVGDPKQLPPFVQSSYAIRNGYSNNLLQRAVQKTTPLLLSIQYRMHHAISSYISDTFYEGRVQTGVYRTPSIFFKWPNPSYPMMFVNANGKEVPSKESWMNLIEAKLVLKYATRILKNGLPSSDLAIIVPYTAQRQLLLNMISKRGNSEMFSETIINTVDALQGDEREFVILSTVRTERIGFLKDQPRINVSVSRAKSGLIAFGHSETLSSSPQWKEFISRCMKNQSYIQ